jgi:DNA-binding MarR family transcriptional regulator
MKLTSSSAVSDLKSHIGFWLRFISNHVSHRFAGRLEGSGVTLAEWVILREVFDVDVTAPSALAKSTGLTRGAVSKLVDRRHAKKLLNP